MAATSFTPSPEVLLERYGVRAHSVFGSTPPPIGGHGLTPSRCHSAGSLGSVVRATATAPPLSAERHWPGRAVAGSLSSSSRSAFDLDKPQGEGETASGRASRALSSSGNSPTNVGAAGVVDSREGKDGALPTSGAMPDMRALSVRELRAIVEKAPRRSRARPPVSRLKEKSHGARGDSRLSFRTSTCSSETKIPRIVPQKGMMRSTFKDPEKQVSMAMSMEDPVGSGEDDDEVEEDEVWNRGAVLRKAHQKKGRSGGHSNLFVEFECREQRIINERRWLRDDHSYMRERIRGMRLDSVQARLDKVAISRDELYQDSVYFSAYACDLRTRHPRKGDSPDSFRESALLPAVGARMGAESEHHGKNKKGQGDQTLQSQTAMFVRNMAQELKESTGSANHLHRM